MSHENSTATTPKPRRLIRNLGFAAALLGIVLVAGWFVVTSAAFLKGVILPRVGDSMNAELTVSDATIQPFKQIVLRDFKLQVRGEEPFFTAAELRCRYSLWDMVGGTLTVEEALLKSPRIHYVQKPDGTSNLEPVLHAAASNPSKPPTKASQPLRLDLRHVAIENAAILYTATDTDGNRTSIELDEASLVLKDLRNGGQGLLELGATLKANTMSAATNSLLQARISGKFTIDLDADAVPESVQGGTTFTVTEAHGVLADLSAFAAALDCQVSATNIQNLSLITRKGTEELAQVHVSGPFDTAKGEGRLAVELSGVDHRFLNLAGAPFGLDFRNSAMVSTNILVLKQHGSEIGFSGQFLAREFAVAQDGRVTPPIEARLDYDVTIHNAQQTFALRAFELKVLQQRKPLIEGRLSSPMTLNWGQGSAGVGDADLKFTLTNLDLRDFRAFTGTNLLGGIVHGALAVNSTDAGRRLDIHLSATGDQISILSGDRPLTGIGFSIQNVTSVENNDRIQINETAFNLTHDGRSALTAQMGGSAELTKGSVMLIGGVVAHLKELSSLLPESGVSFPDETLKAKLLLDAAMANQVATLKRATLSLDPTARATNELTLTGVVDMADTNAITGQIKLAADAVDVTPYYELFERMGSTSTKAEKSRAESASAETEPDAMLFPVKNFVADLTIGHLFLRDVDIANWQATLRVDGGRIALKPCDLKLNGAPVSGSMVLDLGVPGWKYEFAGGFKGVPLAPLVDSILPDRKGQFSGTANAEMEIQGAGITGSNLQKNLSGTYDLGATNLNFTLDNARSKLVRTLSDVLLSLPELVRNPSGAAAGKLLGSLLGGNRPADNGDWSSQVKGSPVDMLMLRGSAGNGSMRVEEALAQSSAYLARLSGEVTLAPVMTNSTLRFPVELSLSRELAAKTGLLPANTPTNAVYARLPDFLTLEGSLGNPKSKINYLTLATLAAQSGASLTGGTGNKDLDKASGILSAVGNLFGGKPAGETNAASEGTTTNTNAPADGANTNAPSNNTLRDLFKR